jgi:site-specific DNA-methyltransferase (adenine-specific)
MSAVTARALELFPAPVTLPQIVTAPRLRAAQIRNALLLLADGAHIPLADASVDLTVTSPPYGAGIAYDGGGDVPPAAWPAFMQAWLAEVYRVTKPGGRLALNVPLDMTGGGGRVGRSVMSRPTYVQAVVAAEAVGWLYKSTIDWHEGNTSKGNRGLGSVNSSARPHHVSSSEMIPLFSKGEWAPSSDNPDDITPAEWQEYSRSPWTFPGQPRRTGGHPAPFPEELPRRCIRYLSRVGDVVLDPFVGSGTTVAVAVAEGRLGVGCDRSADYLEAAAQRIAAMPLRLRVGKRCTICNGLLGKGRRDSLTCSPACRQKAYRQRKAGG